MPDTDLRWTLKVRFHPLQKQAEIDPEREFPHDDATRLVGYARHEWMGGIEEELDEWVQFTDDLTEVTLHCDVIDGLRSILDWIVMSTLPLRLEMTCNEEIQ